MAARRLYPGMPQVPPGKDPIEQRFLEAIKEHCELSAGQRGDTYTKTVSINDLLDIGIITPEQAAKLATR